MSTTTLPTHLVTTPPLPSATPTVSVIIPAYNVAPFIRDTLDSVLAQTFADYEIILINDGSPDTVELEKQIEIYQHLIIYIQQPNLGAGAARNAGLRAARGELVAFLDGDDLWLPEFLEEQLALMKRSVYCDLVYADAVNLHGNVVEQTTNMDINPSTGPVTAESLISAKCNVITSSVVARRELILETGLFDENFPNSQDFDLWLRLAKRGARINYQKKVLVQRRIYNGSLASNPINSFRGEIAVLEKTSRRTDLTADEAAAIQRTIKLRQATIEVCRGKNHLAAGDFASALTAFRNANDYFRSLKLFLVIICLRVAPRLLQRLSELRTA
jgi:glycosyltransferase involved in cell wall biosynthesis